MKETTINGVLKENTNPTEIQYEKNQPLTFIIEKMPIIYFLFLNNKLVYIGKTEWSLPHRILSHKVAKNFDSCVYIILEDINSDELSQIELALINVLDPEYNNSHNNKYITYVDEKIYKWVSNFMSDINLDNYILIKEAYKCNYCNKTIEAKPRHHKQINIFCSKPCKDKFQREFPKLYRPNWAIAELNEKLICENYKSGDSQKKIADNFSCSPPKIREILIKNGVKIRQRGGHNK